MMPPKPRKAILRTLHEQGPDDETLKMTPSERILTMWQLALDSWAFSGYQNDESGFQRHIISVVRREG